MIARGNFLLQARFVLNALIGGSDVERIERHWPGYKITVENGRKFCFEIEGEPDEEIQAPVAQPETSPVDPSTPATPPQPESELDIAKMAAEQANSSTDPNPILPVS